MKFDAMLEVRAADMLNIGKIARHAEEMGYAGIWTAETKHNPLFQLLLAAEHTQRVALGTAILVAFPRSPMVTAQAAWDLQAVSNGRFMLGLGTQVKPHIERRFATAWDKPVARLRDYVLSLRAIWNNFQHGGRMYYAGEFYKFSLMTPFFNPGPIAQPQIPIYIAGVNEGLAQLAGELCDGFHVHPAHTVKYVQEFVKPQIAIGAAKAGRDPAAVSLTSGCFIITGKDSTEMDKTRAWAREQLSFYLSTPSYRIVLEIHGWEDIGAQLSALASRQQWGDMATLISDDILNAFAIEAPPDKLGKALRQRYEGVLDRVSSYIPFVPSDVDDMWRDVITEMHQ